MMILFILLIILILILVFIIYESFKSPWRKYTNMYEGRSPLNNYGGSPLNNYGGSHSNNYGRSHSNNYGRSHLNNYGGSHSNNEQLDKSITLDIKLPHIDNLFLEDNNIFGSESVWVIPINLYSNPLPPKIKNSFWAFYPLTHFQSLIFKKPLMLNNYHKYAIEQNLQFKPLLDEVSKLLKLDLFNAPCINLGLFHKYKQFISNPKRFSELFSKKLLTTKHIF
jgi:hypothetical protein